MRRGTAVATRRKSSSLMLLLLLLYYYIIVISILFCRHYHYCSLLLFPLLFLTSYCYPPITAITSIIVICVRALRKPKETTTRETKQVLNYKCIIRNRSPPPPPQICWRVRMGALRAIRSCSRIIYTRNKLLTVTYKSSPRWDSWYARDNTNATLFLHDNNRYHLTSQFRVFIGA